MKNLKKILFLILSLLFFPLYSFSNPIPDTIYALTPVAIHQDSLKEDETLELHVINTGFMSDDVNLQKGDVIKIKILQYYPETRGKRDAHYEVIAPDINGKEMTGTMRVAKETDYKSIAESAGVTVAGRLLNASFLGQAIAVSKGLIAPNENETRLKSAGQNLYESTPLKYFSKGNSFDVEQYGVIVLKLKEN